MGPSLNSPASQPKETERRAPPGESACEILPWTRWTSAASSWKGLVERAPGASFFLTPEWVETWLETFGEATSPTILVAPSATAPLGATLLARQAFRYGPFAVKRLCVGASGEPVQQGVMSEYNDLLCLPGSEREFAELVARHLRELPWDELAINGHVDTPSVTSLLESLKLPFESREEIARFVDLKGLRGTGKTYLESLSAHARKNLRRNQRACEALGPTTIREPSGIGEALEMLDELVALNRERWRQKGGRSALESSTWVSFHKALVRRAFGSGMIFMARVSAGQELFGILYCFVFRRKVYFYQSGFRYTRNKDISPGLFTLHQVMDLCLKRGFEEFDFLAGDMEYKRSLATGARTLKWTVVRRRTVRNGWIGLARRMKRALVGVRHAKDR